MLRREFLQTAAGAMGTLMLSPAGARAAAEGKKIPVAGVTTVWRKNSHSDVIFRKILEGYRHDGGEGPGLELKSLYVDQMSWNPAEIDLSRGMAKKHGFRMCETIDEAVTLGTDTLPVAGVIIVGEHGNYPYIEPTHQKQYPRRRLFDAVCDAFERVGRVVPVFNDKHLAYNWKDAKAIYDRAIKMNIPFLAGSSIPLIWRVPPLEIKRGTKIEEAMGVGYGENDGYGFHAMEGLQCMAERRAGGETGVRSVEALTGDAITQAAKAGRFSMELFEAAIHTAPLPRPPKPPKEPPKLTDVYEAGRTPVVFLIEYADGLKGSMVMAHRVSGHFTFAAKLAGQEKPVACWYELEDWDPFGGFAFQIMAIEELIRSGKSPVPVERTLLTSGMLDACLQSLAQGKKIETPQLAISYQPLDWKFAPGRPAPQPPKPVKK